MSEETSKNQSTSSEKEPDETELIEQIEKSDIPGSSKMIIMERVSSYSGPLPDPSAFGRYEEILPGAADRILRMAEKEQGHRIDLENKIQQSESRDSLLGIITATVLGVCGLVAGGIAIVISPNLAGSIAGGAIGLSGLGSIAISIVTSTRMNGAKNNKK